MGCLCGCLGVGKDAGILFFLVVYFLDRLNERRGDEEEE